MIERLSAVLCLLQLTGDNPLHSHPPSAGHHPDTAGLGYEFTSTALTEV
jgi:hypothetical protein